MMRQGRSQSITSCIAEVDVPSRVDSFKNSFTLTSTPPRHNFPLNLFSPCQCRHLLAKGWRRNTSITLILIFVQFFSSSSYPRCERSWTEIIKIASLRQQQQPRHRWKKNKNSCQRSNLKRKKSWFVEKLLALYKTGSVSTFWFFSFEWKRSKNERRLIDRCQGLDFVQFYLEPLFRFYAAETH